MAQILKMTQRGLCSVRAGARLRTDRTALAVL